MSDNMKMRSGSCSSGGGGGSSSSHNKNSNSVSEQRRRSSNKSWNCSDDEQMVVEHEQIEKEQIKNNNDTLQEDPMNNVKLLYQIGKGAFGTVNLALIEEKDDDNNSNNNNNNNNSSSSSTINMMLDNENNNSTNSPKVSQKNNNPRKRKKRIALKIVHKCKVIECNMIEQANSELQVLKTTCKHPFIVDFMFAYQTPTKLYIGMEYCPGGELFTHIMNDSIHTDDVRLYVAEIALALRHLHSRNIIYRDLKPENIALAADGHIRLLDFGLSVILNPEKDLNTETNRLEVVTACGTLAYSSPEILKRLRHGFESDWWSLGVICYELLAGYPPFDHENPQTACDLICTVNFEPAENVIEGSVSYDLIYKLLKKNGVERLCYNFDSFHTQLQNHPFFAGLDWKKIENQQVQPNFVPQLANPYDVSCFDPSFTDEQPYDDIKPQEAEICLNPKMAFRGYDQIEETKVHRVMG